jgi:capsular polysaccharide transport system permease protein
MALMLREMSTRYGRTPGGYVWAVLEPVGALAVMAIAFSILLRSPPLGNSFILFYASGYLPFLLYMNIALQVQGAILFSRPLLQYPAVSWIDAILARFVLNLLTGIAIIAIVFTGILQFTTATATLDFGPIVLAVLLSALVGLGMGTMNCLLTGLFPAWGNVWGIISRPLFLISGIFFLYEDMPPTLQNLLWYTPWIHVTGIARTGIFPTYAPDYVSVPLVLAWGLVPLFFGLLLLRRYNQDILSG